MHGLGEIILLAHWGFSRNPVVLLSVSLGGQKLYSLHEGELIHDITILKVSAGCGLFDLMLDA